MDLALLAQQVTQAAEELIAVAQPRAGQIFVVGCSTSEVHGEHIGKGSSEEIAAALVDALLAVTAKHQLCLATQCCEHLNRSLVVERSTMERYQLEEVTVKPVAHAGGAFSTYAYAHFQEPVVVERISAHLGLDIGQTLIGMHLKRVAVPVRLQTQRIGAAILAAARTRPPLVGGARAQYPNNNIR